MFSMLKYNLSTCKNSLAIFKDKIDQGFVSNISVINSRDILISFSNYREKKLLISLNHHFPFIAFVKIDESLPTIVGQLNDVLRKEIRDGQLLDIKLLNDDRVFEFTFSKSNDFYDKEIKYLVLEIIPHKSNLILLNSERKIIFALHYTTLQNYHMVMKGMYYEPPLKKDFNEKEEDNFSYLDVEQYAKEYVVSMKDKRLKEKYEYIYKYVKTRIKSLKNKLVILDKELNKAHENLSYQEHGNMLLACINDIETLNDYLLDNNLTINEDLTVGQNANVYFKKYKKAKRTIDMDKLEQEKTKKEIERLEVLQAQLPFMNDDDMLELAKQYFPNKLTVLEKKKKLKTNISFVKINNTKIYYGKSAKQNEEITFKIAHKDEYYFHIKDYHGAHVLLASNNPTKEEMLLASEICLLLSGKEAGDVQYTEIKNVKKGKGEGMALMNNFQLITLKNVRNSTLELLKNKN